MEQVFSFEEVQTSIRKYPKYFPEKEIRKYFDNPDSYTLKEDDNVAFAECKSQGVYWVHFCFNSCRGRDAIDLTKRMLKVFFTEKDVHTVIGPILLENKKARWLIRQVGFKSLGTTEMVHGDCELFYFTRKDYNNGVF